MSWSWTQFRLYHKALIRNITITPEQDIKTSPLQGCTISSMLSVLIYKPAGRRMIKWSQVSCLRKQCNRKIWTQVFRSEVWGVNHLAVSLICKLVQHWWFNFLIFSAVFVWKSYIFDGVSWFEGMTIHNTKVPIVSLLLGEMTLRACYFTMHPQLAHNEL